MLINHGILIINIYKSLVGTTQNGNDGSIIYLQGSYQIYSINRDIL